MSTGIISWIRTIVPIVMGGFVAWLVALGVHLDKGTEDALVVAVTGLCIAVYYTLARLLEKRFPTLGVLLGVAKTPDSYSKGEASVEAAPIVDSGKGTPIYDEVSAGIVTG